MDTVTNTNPNGKCAQTDDDAELSKNASPLEKAKVCATVALASLPATIKSLAQDFHFTFLALRMGILCLSVTNDQLSQADFVPISVSVKFELTTSK
jgi:hypothetical protein